MNETRHESGGPRRAVNAGRIVTRTTLALMAAAGLSAAVGLAGIAAAGPTAEPEGRRIPTGSEPVIAEPAVTDEFDETDGIEPTDLLAGLPGLDGVFGGDDAGWEDYCPPCGMG